MTISENSSFHKTSLANGITVISEQIPSVRSLAIGIWVKTGSRGENLKENGIAHFLEHMIFKGTRKRSPLRIAQSMESLGGHLNAFTGKEVTCFFANSLDVHLKKSIEILADIVCHSIFPVKEISREKSVVLEEINSVKDSPEELVFDLFHEKLFPENPLGRPILGTEETITTLNRERILSFWQRHYTGENIIISAAGNLDHQQVVRFAEKYFNFTSQYYKSELEPAIPAEPSTYLMEQPINQAHLCIGGESVSYQSKARFPLMIINTYLGGGMSSRLFQQIREKRGLAYSVYSFLDFYSDIGIFGIYAGTDVQYFNKVESILRKELGRLSSVPISKSALSKVKNQLKGNLLLSLENTSRRMSRLARNEIYYGDYVSLDELIQSIDQVNQTDILETAQTYLQPEKFTSVVLKPTH